MRYYPHKTVFSNKIGIGFAQIYYVFELEERTSTHIMDDTKTIAQIDSEGTNETIRYQYDNHLGSASLELDEDANIISYEEYHPFGTTSYRSSRSETEVSLKRYKYVGKERDEETGLYYYGARYYAAWLGRWTSVDPKANELPQYSPYNYVENNPIIKYDPDGKKSKIVVNKNDSGGGTIKISSNIYINPSKLPKSITNDKLDSFVDTMNKTMKETLSGTKSYMDSSGNDWSIGFDVEFIVGTPSENERGANILNVGGTENSYGGGRINLPEQKVKNIAKGKKDAISTVREEAVHTLGFTDRYYIVSKKTGFPEQEKIGFLAQEGWENDVLLGSLTKKNATFDKKHYQDLGEFLDQSLINMAVNNSATVELKGSFDSRKPINEKTGSMNDKLDYFKDLNKDQKREVEFQF